jgi:hypothetical protein
MDKQYVFLWQVFYACTTVLIKASICACLLRLTTQKRYVLLLQGLITLSAALSGAGIVTLMFFCRPVEANWNPALGSCLDPLIISVFTYAGSVVNVLLDLSVAIIPIFLLRDIQMRPKMKMLVQMVLGLGAL